MIYLNSSYPEDPSLGGRNFNLYVLATGPFVMTAEKHIDIKAEIIEVSEKEFYRLAKR